MFIDYGNMEWVLTDSLCKLSVEDTTLPAQAFECVLACVKPAYSMMSEGCWSYKANSRFKELCCNKELIITVCVCVCVCVCVSLGLLPLLFDVIG